MSKNGFTKHQEAIVSKVYELQLKTELGNADIFTMVALGMESTPSYVADTFRSYEHMKEMIVK